MKSELVEGMRHAAFKPFEGNNYAKWLLYAVSAAASVVFILSLFSLSTVHAADQVSTGGNGTCSITSGVLTCDGKVVGPNSPLAGKYVSKVSVGVNHTCALANAAVYCWGANESGQLGNLTNGGSKTPVAVATNKAGNYTIPAYCSGGTANETNTGCTGTTLVDTAGFCIGFMNNGNCIGVWVPPAYVFVPTGNWVPAKTMAANASALYAKEVIDISAADHFTCALSSDGTVACWGEGDSGRLGTGSEDSSNYPKAVYSASDSSFYNKRGIKLATSSGPTMCVTAVDRSSVANAVDGNAFCWGRGMGNDAVPPSAPGEPVKTNELVVPSSAQCFNNLGFSTESTYYFNTDRPVLYGSEVTFKSIKTNMYATGISTSGTSYYWGNNGYKSKKTTKTSCGDPERSGQVSGGSPCGGGGGGSGSPGCGPAKVHVFRTTSIINTRFGQPSATVGSM